MTVFRTGGGMGDGRGHPPTGTADATARGIAGGATGRAKGRDATDAAVECRDLSIVRGRRDARRRVVDGVTFAVPRGGALAVFGVTGAGKSSLLHTLAGDGDAPLRVDGGAAWVRGIRVGRRGRAHRRLTYTVGLVGQDDSAGLPAPLTVSDIIGEPVTGRDRDVDRRALAMRIAGLLDELGLSLGVADRYPYELSAGMRQRVVVARALMLNPAVLAADGLLAHLDVRARALVADAVQRRRRAYGMALLLAGNDVATARRFTAGVLVLHRGHTVAVGPSLDALRWTPDTPVALRRLVTP